MQRGRALDSGNSRRPESVIWKPWDHEKFKVFDFLCSLRNSIHELRYADETAIYGHFAATGQRPSLEVVAKRVHADVSSVREAYLRLRAQRVLVLEPDGVSIRMAPPFSGVTPNMS